MNYITGTKQSFEMVSPLEYELSSKNILTTNNDFDYADLHRPSNQPEQVGVVNNHIIVALNMTVNFIFVPTQNRNDLLLLQHVIVSLLRNRDFLGYQLSYSKGNLSDTQFDVIKQEYLKPNNICDVDTLMENIIYLMKNTEMAFDADQISTIFNCDIDIAEDALTKTISRLTRG